MNENTSPDELGEGLKGPREFFKKHRVAKAATNLIFKAILRAKFGREVTDLAQTSGLLEGTIIGNPLRYPNEEGTSIENTRAAGGSWVGFDFLRPLAFPKAHKRGEIVQLHEGRFFGIILEEVIDKPSDVQTPLGLLQLTNLDHVLQLDTYTAADLLDLGVLTERSYGKAYEEVGLYGQYADELKIRSIVDEPVFQVTPKGNTLTMLVEDGGDPKPQEETEASFVLYPGLRPALIRA